MFLRSIMPEARRGLLRRRLSDSQGPVRILEAHSGLSAIVANEASIQTPSGDKAFDGIWISGLTESASRGLPDIELQGMLGRMAVVREVLTVTNKPIVVDGDTGGAIDQLRYHIRMLESLGISALIIEDKVFPKNNSLDLDKPQVLEDPDVFAHKIRAGKQAQVSPDFMLIARIESLIAGTGLEDALLRAERYLLAGADAIVIHSRSKEPLEVFAFAGEYLALCRRHGLDVPLVCIPTIYNSVTEDELHAHGFKLIVHANYLLRSAYVAMKATANSILENGRSLEVESSCVSLKSLFDSVDQAQDVVRQP
jgi:phosphoenolpyruvate phosphomutase